MGDQSLVVIVVVEEQVLGVSEEEVVLAVVETEVTNQLSRCTQLLVLIVAKVARYPSSLQAISQFIVVIVSVKKAMTIKQLNDEIQIFAVIHDHSEKNDDHNLINRVATIMNSSNNWQLLNQN